MRGALCNLIHNSSRNLVSYPLIIPAQMLSAGEMGGFFAKKYYKLETWLHHNTYGDNYVICNYTLWSIHTVTITSFAITLYGQCCWRHDVGQQVVSDVSIVHCCWSICSLCSEPHNLSQLLVNAVLATSILLHIPNPNVLCSTTWRHVLGDHR